MVTYSCGVKGGGRLKWGSFLSTTSWPHRWPYMVDHLRKVVALVKARRQTWPDRFEIYKAVYGFTKYGFTKAVRTQLFALKSKITGHAHDTRKGRRRHTFEITIYFITKTLLALQGRPTTLGGADEGPLSHITASVACAQDIGATATAFARALASTNVATHVGTSSALLKGGASTLIQLVLVPRAAAAIGLRGELADIAIATVPTTSTSIASVVSCSDAVTAPILRLLAPTR
jgi:hypothetical protein